MLKTKDARSKWVIKKERGRTLNFRIVSRSKAREYVDVLLVMLLTLLTCVPG